jgi:hypothetical protein
VTVLPPTLSLLLQSAPAFGATPAPAFGAQPAPAFGASSTPAFGAASAPAFGAAPTGAFGQAKPAFGGFGAAAASPFGAAPTAAPAFGASAPAFGAASAPGEGLMADGCAGMCQCNDRVLSPDRPAAADATVAAEALLLLL